MELFSLQIDDAVAQIATAPRKIIDLSPFVSDMADTAAQLQQLDLVITVDSAVAHLAGALGIQTWILLPFTADWRWLENRTDSPWYSSVRLFRQPRPGDWQSVMKEVRNALSTFPIRGL
ncbi:ADP-heptose:LPS heptosyltransferase [Tunturiibacter psychrotolerans]